MRIAFAYDLPFPWHNGGIEKMLAEESAELAKDNEVHFFTLRWPGMEKEFVKDGVHYHAYASSSIETAYRHGRRSIRKVLVFAFSLLNLFRYRFDVLIIDQFPYLHIPVAWLFSRLTGCKLVIKVSEVWDKEYWKRYTNSIIGNAAYAFSKFWVPKADFYIANSAETRNKLEEFVGRYSITIIFAPVLDKKSIEDAKRHKTDTVDVVFAGRLIKEKRLDKWVDAVSEAHKIDGSIKGAIIGDGIERKNIEKLIRQSGASGFISLLGRIEKSVDVYRIIASSKLLLNMSEREGLSIVSLESLALGTPVLLPSYTPIPKEVSEMCIVEDESNIPKKIVEICRSDSKSKYIKETKRLDEYYTFNIRKYYQIVFEKLGINDVR